MQINIWYINSKFEYYIQTFNLLDKLSIKKFFKIIIKKKYILLNLNSLLRKIIIKKK